MLIWLNKKNWISIIIKNDNTNKKENYLRDSKEKNLKLKLINKYN